MSHVAACFCLVQERARKEAKRAVDVGDCKISGCHCTEMTGRRGCSMDSTMPPAVAAMRQPAGTSATAWWCNELT